MKIKLIFFRFLLFLFGIYLFLTPLLKFRFECASNTGEIFGISLIAVIIAISQIRILKGGFPILDKKHSKVDKYILLISVVIGFIAGLTFDSPC